MLPYTAFDALDAMARANGLSVPTNRDRDRGLVGQAITSVRRLVARAVHPQTS